MMMHKYIIDDSVFDFDPVIDSTNVNVMDLIMKLSIKFNDISNAFFDLYDREQDGDNNAYSSTMLMYEVSDNIYDGLRYLSNILITSNVTIDEWQSMSKNFDEFTITMEILGMTILNTIYRDQLVNETIVVVSREELNVFKSSFATIGNVWRNVLKPKLSPEIYPKIISSYDERTILYRELKEWLLEIYFVIPIAFKKINGAYIQNYFLTMIAY